MPTPFFLSSVLGINEYLYLKLYHLFTGEKSYVPFRTAELSEEVIYCQLSPVKRANWGCAGAGGEY